MSLIQGIFYLAIAMALFFIFRISARFVQTMATRQKSFKVILGILPLVELLAWVVFVLWLLKRLFSDWEGYTSIMVVLATILMLTAGWYFLRDFIAGIILKSETAFTLNQQIKTPEVSGIIKKIGYRTLEIESESGHFSKIPYSRLSGQTYSLQAPADTMLSHEVTLEIPASQKNENLEKQIIKDLLLLPWVSVSHSPVIKAIDENNETITFKISYHTSNRSQASAINQHLRKRFERK